ncbi:MAG TPA: hypothetical protein VNK04_01175 [Gemmataceae bacterium]|nr:hypothetical protein [Gemmataceae bacterium]
MVPYWKDKNFWADFVKELQGRSKGDLGGECDHCHLRARLYEWPVVEDGLWYYCKECSIRAAKRAMARCA